MNPISIQERSIGPGHPVYIIAEVSANHNQSYEEAVRIFHAAKEAGADAVKLQTYTADTMTIACSREPFLVRGTIWEGRNLHELYREAFTPWEWQPKLLALARQLGMHCFSTPFDHTAVDFLEAAQFPAYKIASFELVDLPLIERIARTGKPIIMSTGMGTLAEIDEAVRTARGAGAVEIALLKCTSAYPSRPEEMNLRTIPHLSKAFQVPVGLSDHTLAMAVPVTAVSLGACIIEKHLALSREVPGPDTLFSLVPDEFRQMVQAVRTAEKALGEVNYAITAGERATSSFRRSLFVVEDVPAGQLLTKENVRSIRPAGGLPPKYLGQVLGCMAQVDIARGTPLAWNLITLK